MTGVKRCIVVACLSPFAACYSYRTVPVDTAPVGATVRARISPAEAQRLGGDIGRETRLFEGALLEKRGNEILIAVQTPVRAGAAAAASAATYQRVGIPREAILELETRRLDRLKTGAVAALAAAVVGYAAVKAFGGEGSPGGPGKEGPDRMVARPRLSVGLRFP